MGTPQKKRPARGGPFDGAGVAQTATAFATSLNSSIWSKFM